MEVTKSSTKIITLWMEGRGHSFGTFTKISPMITSHYQLDSSIDAFNKPRNIFEKLSSLRF